MNSTSPNQLRSSKRDLKTDDFIRLMITQLQNQDPLQPAKNEELMAQMSQISQLQSSTKLQETLGALAVQNQVGAAGNLIGKMVAGLDEQDKPVSGVVTSVRVEKSKVYLELDSGKRLSLDRVTTIAPVTPAAS